MKKILRLLAGAALGVAGLSLTSCYYDPYGGGSTSVGASYNSGGSTSVGASYSSGYGEGYGYGSPSFSTSVFVSTGDPRWGYDPHCYSYYDYHSHRYYDPYLNGYYPLGYRPPVVYGVPHPYGWRPGVRYCPPPRGYRNVTVVNYRNRAVAYQGTGYGWARQVRQQPASQGRVTGSRPAQGYNDRPNTGSRPQTNHDARPNTGSRPQTNHDARPNTGSRPAANRGSDGNRNEFNDRMTGQRPKQGNAAQYNRNNPVNEGRPAARQGSGNQGQKIQGNRPQQGRQNPGNNGGGNRKSKQQQEEDARVRGQRF